ncbi:MAG: hypothetical protein Gyms2KO_03400 [Gymnodinialimonas sp.]
MEPTVENEVDPVPEIIEEAVQPATVQTEIVIPEIEPLEITVLGVMIEENGAHALIERPNHEAEWVSRGGFVEQWELVEIERDEIVLEFEDRQSTYAIFDRND